MPRVFYILSRNIIQDKNYVKYKLKKKLNLQIIL